MHGFINQQVNTYLSMICVAVVGLGAAYLMITFTEKTDRAIAQTTAQYNEIFIVK